MPLPRSSVQDAAIGTGGAASSASSVVAGPRDQVLPEPASGAAPEALPGNDTVSLDAEGQAFLRVVRSRHHLKEFWSDSSETSRTSSQVKEYQLSRGESSTRTHRRRAARFDQHVRQHSTVPPCAYKRIWERVRRGDVSQAHFQATFPNLHRDMVRFTAEVNAAYVRAVPGRSEEEAVGLFEFMPQQYKKSWRKVVEEACQECWRCSIRRECGSARSMH